MNINKITATFHYLPLCKSPYYNKLNKVYNVNSIRISNEIIRLPLYPALKKESPETVNKMGYAKKGGRIVTAMTGGQIVSMMYDD